jgi:hypothetical protein
MTNKIYMYIENVYFFTFNKVLTSSNISLLLLCKQDLINFVKKKYLNLYLYKCVITVFCKF